MNGPTGVGRLGKGILVRGEGSGSETGSCLRLIDFVYQSTLGLRAMQKKKVRFGE
jgi:hypothetical protein